MAMKSYLHCTNDDDKADMNHMIRNWKGEDSNQNDRMHNKMVSLLILHLLMLAHFTFYIVMCLYCRHVQLVL